MGVSYSTPPEVDKGICHIRRDCGPSLRWHFHCSRLRAARNRQRQLLELHRWFILPLPRAFRLYRKEFELATCTQCQQNVCDAEGMLCLWYHKHLTLLHDLYTRIVLAPTSA